MRWRHAAALSGVFAAAACSAPHHTNTLMFATDSRIALDVSANAMTSSPQVTIGYRRTEGVFMPLVPNRDNRGNPTAACEPGATGTAAGQCLIQGQGEGANGASGGRDAYSVLASFGASASGGATANALNGGGGQPGGNVTGSATVAQFFATGIAAQRLAQNAAADRLFRADTAQEAPVTPEGERARQDAVAVMTALGKAGDDAAQKTALAKWATDAGLPQSTRNNLERARTSNTLEPLLRDNSSIGRRLREKIT